MRFIFWTRVEEIEKKVVCSELKKTGSGLKISMYVVTKIPKERPHLDHEGAHIFLFHDYGIVARTIWEARCIVVDVLDLYDDLTLALAGRRPPTAPAIVHRSDVEMIGNLGLIEGSH